MGRGRHDTSGDPPRGVRRRVLEGVRHQVQKHLIELVGIGEHLWETVWQLGRDPLGSDRYEADQNLLEHPAHLYRAESSAQASGLDPRHRQKVVYQTAQTLRGIVYVLERLLGTRRVQVASRQEKLG